MSMKFLLKHKLIIILAIVVAILAWWGLSGLGGAPSSPSLLSTQGGDKALTPADQNLVATLLQLRAVKLDGTIFSEPAFAALKDFSTPIVPEPVGRQNPFEPFLHIATSSNSSAPASSIFRPGR